MNKLKSFLFHLIFWGIPLACAIGIAALVYPRPIYILGAFGGAFIGFIISTIVVVMSFPSITKEQTSSDTSRTLNSVSDAPVITKPYVDKYTKEKVDADKQTEGLRAPESPCSVCGKPGSFYNYPNMPVSDFFCDECSPGIVIKPLHVIFYLALLIGMGWLIYKWFFN